MPSSKIENKLDASDPYSMPVYYCTPHGNVAGKLFFQMSPIDQEKELEDAGLVQSEERSPPTYGTLFFQPLKQNKRNQEIFALSQMPFQYFQASVDVRDVVSVSKLRSLSEGAGQLAGQGSERVRSSSLFYDKDVRNFQEHELSIKKRQIFDYYLQLDIACISGSDFTVEEQVPYQIRTQDGDVV